MSQVDLFGMQPAENLEDESTTNPELGQWFTPDWAARALVEHYFPNLGSSDFVVEPSCGRGAFLRALPADVPALGVEIDPKLARAAERLSGRPVVVGDFATCELPARPTALVGNPPFTLTTIQRFLDRACELLPDEGRAGLLLPAYTFQTSLTVEKMARRWSIRQDAVPRDLFPGLSLPLCFAVFTKGARRGLVNFALYHEQAAVRKLQKRYQQLLREGEGNVWAAVTRAALESLGGTATLQDLYQQIQGHQPTGNPFWKEKVRQMLRNQAVRVGPGRWSLNQAMAA